MVRPMLSTDARTSALGCKNFSALHVLPKNNWISVYIYTYIYREIIDAGDPNREIGFGFVSCSCRACERAGEAKLCGRVREQCLSTLAGPQNENVLRVRVFLLRFCCYTFMGF